MNRRIYPIKLDKKQFTICCLHIKDQHDDHIQSYFVCVGRTSILLGNTLGFIFNKLTIISPISDG